LQISLLEVVGGDEGPRPPLRLFAGEAQGQEHETLTEQSRNGAQHVVMAFAKKL